MYNEGFGNLFHPKAVTISCRDFIRYYPYATEKNWNHGRQGKWIERKGNQLKIKRCEGVMGQAVKCQERCHSPLSERKLRREVQTEEVELPEIPVECIPKYPSWKTQNYNILSRTDCPRHLEEPLQQEVATLWEKWNLSAAKDYLIQKEDFCPQYNATPPWKGALERNMTTVSQRLRISTQIAQDFHQNHRSFALFDCQNFFGKEQAVEDFKRELKEFMKHASQRIRVKWPLSVGRIMLKEGDIWIPKLVDGSCKEIFAAVAATMSRLLYDVLEENYQQFRRVFSESDRSLLKIVIEEGEESFDLWESIEVFKEIAVVPRVEHLLYPRHFPPRNIDIRDWIRKEKRELGESIPRELTMLKERLDTLKTEIDQFQLSMETLPQWEKFCKELEIISGDATAVRAVINCPPLCYDQTKVKNNLLKEIKQIEEKMKRQLLGWQAKKNQKSHALFAEWCRLLCDANVLEQLQRVGELNTQLPVLENRVSAAHLVYSAAWNHFNLPGKSASGQKKREDTDGDLRDYWEVARLPKRLATLAGYIWQRVEQDREWITRKVVDRTSNNYFEAETIERELEQSLKRYKNQTKGPEIQRIATKLIQLAVRCRDLVQNEKELQGERELLGLPGFGMDLQAMLKVTEYFAELAGLQYRTMIHEQNILESHVMDLNHEDTVKATDEFYQIYTKLLGEAGNVEAKYTEIPLPILEKTKERLEKVARLFPVINAVHNQGMKERHWQEVLKEVEMGAELRGNPIVGDLLQMNITEKAEKLEEISAVAEKEMQLETTIHNMKAQWNLATFDIRSRGVLISTELSTQMAAHIAKSQQILTSPYAFTILEQLRTWLDTLLQLHSFVELHSQCERLWHRVEGVFSTEDVAYQMPTEFRIFKKISLLWQQVNSRITDEKPILEQLGVIIELNDLLKELQEDFIILEKGFHSYLRKKRLVFPRLHFLSDERLLHLLSISRDPPAVNQVIRHLFPHFKMAVFNKRGEVDAVDLLDGKRLKLLKPINVPVAKRHAEKWLAELDRETKTTVRLQIKSLLEKYSFTLVPVGEILEEETHVVVIFYRIVLTHMVEEALRHSQQSELEDILKKSLLAAGTFLDGPRRQKVESLMTVIHRYIEIVQELMSKRVIFADDIVWKSKVRLYWNLEHVFIRVFDIATRYDYDILTPISNMDSHHLLGITLTWNRFAIPLAIQNILPASQMMSSALGRPLLDVVSEKQPFEGGLWLGPVAIEKEKTSNWRAAVVDVKNNVSAGNNKILVNSGDIPINPSLLPIFSSFGKWIGEFDEIVDYLAAMFTIYDLTDPRRWAIRVYHISTWIPYLFNLPPISLPVINNIWREAAHFKRNEDLAEKQAVDRSLFRGISPQITDELWPEFIGLLPEVGQAPSTDRKCQELLQILASQKAAVVCGPSLSGKTRLIEEAAQLTGVQLHANGEIAREEGWWLVDGDRDKISWLLTVIQTTMLSFDPFIIPDNPSFRLIFECDTVPIELLGQMPIILTNDSTIQWPSIFSLSDVVSLSAVIKELPEFSSRLFHDRMSALSVVIEKEEASFLQVVAFGIDSLGLTDETRQNCMKSLQDNYPGYFLPPTLTWEKCLNSLFSLGYVVFLPSSHGQSLLLEKVVAHLEAKELAVVEVNLNTIIQKEDIEEFLERCELLFGGERNVVVCLKDFHLSSRQLQEFMRHSRKTKAHRFLVTSNYSLEQFPERLRRFLFLITDQTKEKFDVYPLKVYEEVIEASSRNKARDVKEAVRNEMSRSLSELTHLGEKYTEVKRMLEEDIKQGYRLVRDKELCDVDELIHFYQQQQNEKRKSKVLEDEPIVTEYVARRLCFLEKSLSTEGSVVIYDQDKRYETQYWIELVAGINGLELTQTIFGILTADDLHKVLRRCLLEDQPVLLAVDINPSTPLQLLYSLVVSKCVPPAFLSQQLVTEFCEKHTVEGRGMWKRMSGALAKMLRVCLLVEKNKFKDFYKQNTELCEVSLIEWSSLQSTEDIAAAVATIVRQANVLDDSQTQEFHRILQKVDMPKEEDKIRLAKTFVHIAKKRRDAVNKIMNRYERGMEKLRLAEEQTGSLQAELSRLRPELVRTSIETSMLMSSIERETIEVENAREVVAANEHKSNQAAIAAQALRAESEADLANAIPALEASVEALETLNQSDVSTLKTMRFPPFGVRICMEAVCILLGESPARIPSPDGGFVNDYWPTGLKMLSDIHFLSRIRNFPRDSVSRKTMKLIKDRYLSKPEFDPEHIKQCSLAAEGLCLWVKAIEFYHRISRIVEPKKEKLRQAELLVKTHLKQLEVKRKALQKVTEKLQQLSDQFGQMSQRKQDLQTQITTCEARIDRAERLVAALEGEKEKWLLKMDSIRSDLKMLPHYCLIAALCLEKYSHQTQTQQRESLRMEEAALFNSNKSLEITKENLLNLCNYPFLLYNDYGRGWKTISKLFPNIIRLDSCTSPILRQHALGGTAVFLADNRKLREIVNNMKFGEREEKQIVVLDGEEIEIAVGFLIFVSSPNSTKADWKFPSINMEYSKEELKEQIFLCLGRENWQEVQTASDKAQEAVREDVTKLDEMETNMLELLGRKEEDLDDEGAVELLAITHETQERLKQRQRELDTAENKLEKEKEKYLKLVEWAADVVLFVKRFGEHSPFYNMDVEKLIQLMDTKINEHDLTMSHPPNVWKSFWHFCCPFLNHDNRKILYCGLKSLHARKSITPGDVQTLLEHYEEPDQSEILSEIIWTAYSKSVLISLVDPKCEASVMVREIAKGVPVQWTSFPEFAIQNLEHLADSPTWLVVTISNPTVIDQLLSAFKCLNSIHASFRLLVVLSSLGDVTPDCLSCPIRLCLSSPSSFSALLRHTANNSTFKLFFHSAAHSKRSNIIRLVAFHFAVRNRIRDIDDVELRMALTLFKETHCDEEKEMEDLFERIIGTIYLPRAQNKVEKTLIKTIFTWIYQGLNRMDDSAIKGCIGGELEVETVLLKLKNLDDGLFSGRAPRLVENMKRRKMGKIAEELNLLMSSREIPKRLTGQIIQETSVEWRRGSGISWRDLINDELALTNGDTKKRDYLTSLLQKETIVELDVCFISNLKRILAIFAAHFSLSQKIPLDEVVINGNLDGKSTANRMILRNCVIRGARWDQNELKEQEKMTSQNVDVILLAGKKTSTKQEKTLPLLDGQGHFLCDVTVRTNISQSHWHLRGAHFSTQ